MASDEDRRGEQRAGRQGTVDVAANRKSIYHRNIDT